MFTVDEPTTGPASPTPGQAEREHLVLEARDVEFDWARLSFHYIPNEPLATHFMNVLHLLLSCPATHFTSEWPRATCFS